jgi:hypothetical protein
MIIFFGLPENIRLQKFQHDADVQAKQVGKDKGYLIKKEGFIISD